MFFFDINKYNGKQFGMYTIEAPIGEGRYGMCFTAYSTSGKKVVIKKFKPKMFKSNSNKNAYEAIILSNLKDYRVPELLGVINENGFYGFVLELKEGFTVKDMLFKNKHIFSKAEFYQIGLKLIRIIKYLHENNVVHKDIRIPNVMINNDEVYLIDFGLARWHDDIIYPFDIDFSYLGDFLLYILYSSFKSKKKISRKPWYVELTLTNDQKVFLKKLLGIEIKYKSIQDIEMDFINIFKVE
ncbi:MAG: protein kinase family protein [Clostridium sp.]